MPARVRPQDADDEVPDVEIVNVLDGMTAWNAAGYPTTSAKRGHGVLPITWTTVRLFLHVLAATVWVGGQLTLAGLVPGLRRVSPEAPRAVARRFNTIAWLAFAVLVATGIWNILAVRPNWSSAYGTTLIVKLVVVAGSGLTAAVHARARSGASLAVFGALSGLTALGALFLGVLLAG